MGKTKPAHHRGSYQAKAKQVRDRANANPATQCWRCGLTLDQHAPHRDGKPAQWQAGHTRDGDTLAPLAPEASTCNQRAAAAMTNGKTVGRTTRRW